MGQYDSYGGYGGSYDPYGGYGGLTYDPTLAFNSMFGYSPYQSYYPTPSYTSYPMYQAPAYPTYTAPPTYAAYTQPSYSPPGKKEFLFSVYRFRQAQFAYNLATLV